MRPKGYLIPSGYLGFVGKDEKGKEIYRLFPTEDEYLEEFNGDDTSESN